METLRVGRQWLCAYSRSAWATALGFALHSDFEGEERLFDWNWVQDVACHLSYLVPFLVFV
jgi:hypothetical protein